MESINLGAVLFGILLLLWLAYALPRTASRREVMGRTHAADHAEMSSQARDLSAAVHARRTSSPEVNPSMSQDRLLLRPADPTRRPRFDAEPGTRMEPVQERARSRWLLGGLLAVTAILIVLAVVKVVIWWAPLIALAGVGVFLLGLRRAEIDRRARETRAATRARQERAQEETARRREQPAENSLATASTLQGSAATMTARKHPAPARDTLESTSERAAAQVTKPGEWTPRPVPRPTYALRGEVDDLGSRHAAHRRSMLATSVPLENERVEELEAVDESFAPAQDLRLDEILARRRA